MGFLPPPPPPPEPDLPSLSGGGAWEYFPMRRRGRGGGERITARSGGGLTMQGPYIVS